MYGSEGEGNWYNKFEIIFKNIDEISEGKMILRSFLILKISSTVSTKIPS